MERTFSTGQVSRLTGVLPATLNYWHHSGFLSPSIRAPNGKGTARKYSFRDIVAARVARGLREQGISLQQVREVVVNLRKLEELDQPLASTHLIVRGADVFRATNMPELVSLLKSPGQLAFEFVADISDLVEDLRREAVKLAA
jgi:DNA-binding transcriptional MerR regulator